MGLSNYCTPWSSWINSHSIISWKYRVRLMSILYPRSPLSFPSIPCWCWLEFEAWGLSRWRHSQRPTEVALHSFTSCTAVDVIYQVLSLSHQSIFWCRLESEAWGSKPTKALPETKISRPQYPSAIVMAYIFFLSPVFCAINTSLVLVSWYQSHLLAVYAVDAPF